MQFESRKNGGKIIAMDNLLVYTDQNGEPEQVVEINQDDLWLQNDIQQALTQMEMDGDDIETQRIVLESLYGTGSAYFRDRGAVPEPTGKDRAGTGRNARAVRKGNRIEISYEDEEVADIIRDCVTKSYSLASWTPEERRTVRETLLEKGYEPESVEKWIDDVDGVASIVANDKARLDFTADPDHVMLKNNQEYVKTLDASTLCAKRLLYQSTFNEIQHLLPNTLLTSDQLLDLLNMMKDAGYESPCGVCYVESRRRHLGKYAQEWLDGYNGEYKPTLDEVTTTDGLAKLKKEHPKAHDAFIAAMKAKGSANPKAWLEAADAVEDKTAKYYKYIVKK